MEAASASRRLRLEALKKRKAELSASDAPSLQHSVRRAAILAEDALDDDEEESVEKMNIAQLLRSLRRVAMQGKRVKYDDLKDTIEKDIEGYQEGVIAADDVRREEELDLTNIAPRKPNWDLKRDMEKRLAKLERRDKEARLILIRQRVTAAKNEGVAPPTGSAAAATLTAQEAELAASTMGAGNARLQEGAGEDSDEESE